MLFILFILCFLIWRLVRAPLPPIGNKCQKCEGAVSGMFVSVDCWYSLSLLCAMPRIALCVLTLTAVAAQWQSCWPWQQAPWTYSCHYYAPWAMGSQLNEDLLGLTIDGPYGDKWSRRSVRLKLDMISAFESGDFYDCTIRVGYDLQNSNASFRVRPQYFWYRSVLFSINFHRTSNVTSLSSLRAAQCSRQFFAAVSRRTKAPMSPAF